MARFKAFSPQGMVNGQTVRTIDASTPHQIERSIPASAKFPPGVDSVEKALESPDVAYRMNHHGGKVGHYQFSKTAAQQATMFCNNPYPCEFDRGLVLAVARRFQPAVRVQHDPGKPCRTKQGDSCTYHIVW